MGMHQPVSYQKRAFAKSLRTNATETEKTLWRLLRSRRLTNLKFRRQVPIGPWVVDFVSFERRLIVEADGSQHAESERDEKRDRDLTERGFRVLRFWNNDILQRSEQVLEAIYDAAQTNPSPVCAPRRAHPPSPTRGEGSKSE
ncbi:endonuclease domain-containing protein [Tardiphaga sp.]|jgi:very-short-patch-repair endonuclease|uniref:endonuclease domain-containing protein n=1 Tax=Tardiphaga sp. TaxID=1926292 RepID=UPI0037DA20BA